MGVAGERGSGKGLVESQAHCGSPQGSAGAEGPVCLWLLVASVPRGLPAGSFLQFPHHVGPSTERLTVW